jgi:hypothetical protein
MIWLLCPPPPPPVLSQQVVYLFSVPCVGRSSLLMRGGGETNHTTARKPGPLLIIIIQYSRLQGEEKGSVVTIAVQAARHSSTCLSVPVILSAVERLFFYSFAYVAHL